MKRRHFLAASLALVAAPVNAQPRIRRIGVLGLDDRQGLGGATLTILRGALRAVGYEEGRNLRIEERWAAGDFAKLDEFARELARLELEVIVPITNYEIAALKRAQASVPVVMYFGALPVELGFVQSLARPGANVTGTAYHSFETAGKILALLQEAAPTAKRTALLWNPDFPGMRLYGSEVDRVAPARGMTVKYFDATKPDHIASALTQVASYRPDALFVAYDSVIGLRLDQITDFARERRLISIGSSPVFAYRGGCLAYGPDLEDVAARTASHIDRILRGAKPADLPVEEPRRFQLVVNLSTARAIGHAWPSGFLARADRVIE